ncbi:hypothetical protein [Rhodococcus aetherivorans]|uniref:hypothetical protein n=1 Tax=Rhodococcus aetherivorans TaxID=191292 RepID=UPI00388FFAD1
MKTIEEYFEHIARDAQALVDDVRSVDPREVLREVMTQCEAAPLRMAQIVMALAAWVDPDETISARGARIEAITAPPRPG